MGSPQHVTWKKDSLDAVNDEHHGKGVVLNPSK